MRTYIITIILITAALPAPAMPTVRISDIIGNPTRYRDVRVKVTGLVTKVDSDPYTSNGVIYTIQDASNQVIRIKSMMAPELESRVTVVGGVVQDSPGSKPYIIEIKRALAGIPLWVLVSAGGVFGIAAIILAYYAFVPRPVSKKKIASDTGRQSEVQHRPVITQVFRDDPIAILVAINGPHKGDVFKLFSGANTIGRDDNQTVRLANDTTVSRSHARINAVDGVIKIINESSTNPTRIDGVEAGERELKDGNIIQVGSTKLRFTIITGD